jgi:hypothetical protein
MTNHNFTPGPTPNTVRSADGRVLTVPEGDGCCSLRAEGPPWRGPMPTPRMNGRCSSLHLMSSAFATENVSRFLGALSFTLSWLFATADVGASLIAADDLLLGRSVRFFLIFRHFQVSLGSVRVNAGSNVRFRAG